MIPWIKDFLKRQFPQLVYWKRCRYIDSCIAEQKNLPKTRMEKSLEGPATDLSLFEQRYFSQNGEDGIILFIVDQLQLEKGTFLEIGSGDRLQCMGANLALCQGWNGVLLDAASFESRTIVDRIYDKYQKLHGSTVISDNSFLTKENMQHRLSGWLQRLGTTQIDLLSIDINGNDYHILKDILKVISPKVLCLEYNGSIPPHLSLTIPYVPDFERFSHHPSGMYYGASLSALSGLAQKHGYALVGTDSCGVNAFFVARHLLSPSLTAKDVTTAFRPNSYKAKYGGVDSQFAVIKDMPWSRV